MNSKEKYSMNFSEKKNKLKPLRRFKKSSTGMSFEILRKVFILTNYRNHFQCLFAGLKNSKDMLNEWYSLDICYDSGPLSYMKVLRNLGVLNEPISSAAVR